MESTVTFRRDSKIVKKPLHLKNGVFLIYAPRQLKLSPTQFERYDAEVAVILPENSCGYFTSKFKIDEIEQISGDIQRIWIEILNRSFTEEIVIKKSRPFGFFVLETKGKINIKYETAQKTKKTSSKISKKKTKEWFFKQI